MDTLDPRHLKLKAWLEKHNARMLTEAILSGTKQNPLQVVQSWQANAIVFLLVFYYTDRKVVGFDLYTSETSGKMAATFLDAEQRLGLCEQDSESEQSSVE